MITTSLHQILEGLELLSNKAVFFRDKEDGDIFTAFSSETQKKLDIIQPDAFFVFNNQPYILFFDLTEDKGSQREQNIHKQVWSFDYSPLIFVIKGNEIQIFNAFSYDKKKGLLQEIKLTNSDRNKIFSFWNLQSGESWKWLQENYYKTTIQNRRVNQKLFENIKLVRETLTDQNQEDSLTEDEANILILRLIFIRYLIDRDVKMDAEYIKGDSILERRMRFSELVEKPRKLNQFFEQLNDKFNGVLFKDIKVQLSRTQAKYLSQVFNAANNSNLPDLFANTDYYFEIFDFSIIPVEVISGIYESLISEETRNEHSAIYTPSFLVEYILTETVDKYLIENKTAECKVFDPACGSGIFLVQSYRRMVEKEKQIYGEKIKKTRLKEIALNNLFGIDLNAQALKVSCFSIYIALLDYQDPKTILDNFQFPSFIGENLFEANFFNTTHSFNDIIKSKRLDFVLGNPPWKNGGKDKIHVQYLKDNDLLRIVSDYQLAQSFIIRTKDFLNTKTRCSLIVTSKAFYNNNADNFRRYFLKGFYLNGCFDLSAVRRLIFEGADNPAMILHYQHAKEKDTLENIVTHYSLKYNIYLKYYKALVIEKNDKKQIKQRYFYDYHWMFKVALYGGILDFTLLKRLITANETIESKLENKYSIEAGNGIHKGTAKKFYTELVGMPIIETDEIEQYYTPISGKIKKLKKQDVFLERGRTASLFKGNKILLTRRPKKETFIHISLCKEDAVFRNSAYGIALKDNKEILAQLYSVFISNLFTYYQYLTTSNWGIYHPEINKEEYLSFPFIEIDNQNQKRIASLVQEFLNPFISYYKGFTLGNPHRSESVFQQINNAINQVYELKDYEKDLMDYVLNISIYQFQGEEKQKEISGFTYTKEAHHRNRNLVLTQYANVFLQEFAQLYINEYLQIEVYVLEKFIAMNFSFLKSQTIGKAQVDFIDDLEIKTFFDKISNLSISKLVSSNNPKYNLFIQKDIKGFENNSFYIIKPNEYKCWHRAMAWYDVAEIKEAIEMAELIHLNETSDVS